jgi:CheY-like chemotaxis protein
VIDAEGELRAHHPGARILVAEDEMLNRLVTIALLETVGLQADAAADGQAALDLARARHYDLILMDLYMPTMDGVAATRLIRHLPGWEHTPILALTATALDEDRQRCLDAGMDDFITKPVAPKALYATLSRWLGRGAAKAWHESRCGR